MWLLKKLHGKLLSSLLFGIAAITFIAVTVLLIELLSLQNMFPPHSKRFDINELGIGTVADLCGLTPRTNTPPAIPDYESCVAKIDEDSKEQLIDKKMVFFPVPKLEEIYKHGRPSVQASLKGLSEPIARRVYSEMEPFVIKVQIPDAYFSPRIHDNDHFKLVHGYMRNAIICVEGKCDFSSTLTDQGVMSVPLFRDELKQPNKTTHNVWIFGRHIDWGHTMSLQNGIFVAMDSDLWQAKRFYPLNMNAGMLAFSMTLSSIFVILFVTSLIWRDYTDHIYLLLLGVNFSALAIYDRVMAPQSVVDHPILMVSGHVLIWSAVAGSMIAYSLTTLRLSAVKNFWALILSIASLLAYGNFLIFASGSSPEKAQLNFDNIFHFIMSVIPVAIGLFGVITCWQKHSKALSRFGETSLSIAFFKRFKQQIFFTVAFFAFNWSSFENYFMNRSIGRIEPISTPLAIIAYFAIFLNMVRPSILRLKRAMDLRDTVSEAGVLKLLLGKSEFEKWKSQSRSGYVIEADIRGSTNAIPELKQGLHTIMKVLKQMIINDLVKRDYVINIMKPMGDAWIFIIQPVGGKPEMESFKNLVEDFSNSLAGYERILQTCAKALLPADSEFTIEEIGLNLRIFSVGEFYLRQTLSRNLLEVVQELGIKEGVNLDLDREDDSDIDFVGEEAHVMLKYLPKPSINLITVGCSTDLVPPSWNAHIEKKATIDDLIKRSTTANHKSTLAGKKWNDFVTFQIQAVSEIK